MAAPVRSSWGMRSFRLSSMRLGADRAASLLGSGLLLCGFALVGCDTSTLPEGYVGFVTAPGDDPWSIEPAASHVRLDFVQDTTRSTLADVGAPPDAISLGNGGPSDVVAHFEVTGLTSSDDAVVSGVSVPFYVQGFAGAYVPLFVGRKGGFSLAPTPLSFAHAHPLSAIGSASYLFVVGSGDAKIDIYDAATWGGSSQTTLPQTVKSMAVAGTLLLIVNDDSAVWIDRTSSLTTPAKAPAGLAFADIVGGQTLVASDRTIYIVGATRTEGDATNQVLEIDPDGTLHTLLLKTPRLGAAATLVEDALLVAGGSAQGSGAELRAVGADGFSALDFPADETVGAGLVELTSNTALLVGGHDASGAPSSTRTLDLGCSSECTASGLPSVDVNVRRVGAFMLDQNVALVVGETDDEQTHAYLFDASGDEPTLTEQNLRTPRARASAARLPNGQIAIVGGTELSTGNAALGLDVFFP